MLRWKYDRGTGHAMFKKRGLTKYRFSFTTTGAMMRRSMPEQGKDISVVEITDRAIEQLEALRDANTTTGEEGITLIPRENGELGFGLAAPQETDHVVEREGKPVMIIPEPLIEPFDNIRIDYVDTPDMQGFTLEQQEQQEQPGL